MIPLLNTVIYGFVVRTYTGYGLKSHRLCMTKANFGNRTLFHGDNLDFLRAMNSETVHLIATDPPFNKWYSLIHAATRFR